MMKFITRGPKIGICNICGEHGELTEDHTPPKGSIKITQVEMHHIAAILSAEQTGSRGRVSQNGVKFRSLCGRCNNTLLGGSYDPEFNKYIEKVGSYLKSRIKLPTTMQVRGKPQRIIRSLLGHIAAQGVERYKKGSHTEDLRDYILDDAVPLMDYVDIYYWVYPYKIQVLARDVVMRDLRVMDTAYIWLLKFFPIAFLVVWDNPDGYDYDFPNLANYRNLGIDDEVEIPILLNKVPHERWPEAPDDHRFVMYGEAAMGVHEKKPKKSR